MTSLNLEKTLAVAGIEMAAKKLRLADTPAGREAPFETHLRHAADPKQDRRGIGEQVEKGQGGEVKNASGANTSEKADAKDAPEKMSRTEDTKAKKETGDTQDGDEEEGVTEKESKNEEPGAEIGQNRVEETPIPEDPNALSLENSQTGEDAESEGRPSEAETGTLASPSESQKATAEEAALPGDGIGELEIIEPAKKDPDPQGEGIVERTSLPQGREAGEGAGEETATGIKEGSTIEEATPEQQQGEGELSSQKRRTAEHDKAEERTDAESGTTAQNESPGETAMARHAATPPATLVEEKNRVTVQNNELKTNDETVKASSAGTTRPEGDGINRTLPQGPSQHGETSSAHQDTGAETPDRARFVQRVAKAFETFGQRSGTVRLRLSPPELGSLRLEITVRNGTMTARVEADTQEARNMLLDNLPALRDRLTQQNIKLERFDVDYRDPSSGGPPPGPGDQQQSSGERSRRDTPAVEPDAPSQDENLLETWEMSERLRSGEGGHLNVII